MSKKSLICLEMIHRNKWWTKFFKDIHFFSKHQQVRHTKPKYLYLKVNTDPGHTRLKLCHVSLEKISLSLVWFLAGVAKGASQPNGDEFILVMFSRDFKAMNTSTSKVNAWFFQKYLKYFSVYIHPRIPVLCKHCWTQHSTVLVHGGVEKQTKPIHRDYSSQKTGDCYGRFL